MSASHATLAWSPGAGKDEFTNEAVKGRLSFNVSALGSATSVTLYQHGRVVEMPRVSESEADEIETKLSKKIKSQRARPGSEEALRRLIEGTMSGNPNYSEMSPALQKATREQLSRLKEGLNKMGPVQTVEFVGVGNQGWDVYQVRYESGTSTWRIHLADSGIIDGALVNSGP